MSSLIFTTIFATKVLFGAITPQISGDPMKLMNMENGFVVVEFFDDGTYQFNDPILKAQLEQEGIRIPPPMQESFNGKKFIKPTDKDFQRAFVEVYYSFSVKNKDVYQLTD